MHAEIEFLARIAARLKGVDPDQSGVNQSEGGFAWQQSRFLAAAEAAYACLDKGSPVGFNPM